MAKIVIIDSGSGGLNVLNECKKLLPNEEFIYYADTPNAPYGDKKQKELKSIARSLVEKFSLEYDPDIFVLACNTLTTNTISYLRKIFPDKKFVGTEPALKPALKKYAKKDVLLFATHATIKKCKIHGIKKIYIKNLPKLIDENLDKLYSLNPILIKYLLKNKYKNIKAIVLGCTHFIYLKNNLNIILGDDIEFFDNAKGVAQRVKSLLN